MLPRGGLEALVQRLLDRVVGCQVRRQSGDEDEDQDDAAANHRGMVAAQTTPARMGCSEHGQVSSRAKPGHRIPIPGVAPGTAATEWVGSHGYPDLARVSSTIFCN